MYSEEFKNKDLCERCGNKLSTRQKRWCSKHCSVLGLKRDYRKRNPQVVAMHRKRHRSKTWPINYKTAQKIRKDQVCAKCGTDKQNEIHHIKPITKGGKHELNNMIILCKKHHYDFEKRMIGFWD